MIRAIEKPWRLILAAGALALFMFVLFGAGSARAASYGDSTFSGSAEGWRATKASCAIPVQVTPVCAASGEYDGAVGNPAGSLAARASVLVNLLELFKSETVLESPPFAVGDSGAGTLNLQRAFSPGGLATLAPSLTYSATLVDKTNGQAQRAIAETVTTGAPFASKSGQVSLTAGHTYTVVIEATTSATVLGLGVTGASTASFDNVSVTGPGPIPGGPGEGGGFGEGEAPGGGEVVPGLGGLTFAQFESIIRSSLGGVAAAHAGSIAVKAKCPARLGVACTTTVQGMTKKGRAATAPRTAKIAKAKAKRLTLRVKPKAKRTVAKRRKLLFKVTVKAGGARATIYKSLKLIRR